MSGGGPVDADTFVGEASFRAALYAAGGACQMVERLLDGDARLGFSGLRPAGHHAERDRAMGFCLFNNVAIAAESAIVDHGLERVLFSTGTSITAMERQRSFDTGRTCCSQASIRGGYILEPGG